MIDAIRNAWRLPDLRNKLLMTGLILLIYQFATHVPVIGVDPAALKSLLDSNGSTGIVGVLNLLSGGAVSRFSVIANGVYPYITASIIFQLLIPLIPSLEALQREPGGKEKLENYTYYLAIPMALLQAVSQINIFNALNNGQAIIPGFGNDPLLTITVLTTMTAGTMFAIWLGELITEQGIGNGLSIIIFAGIVARAPQSLLQLLSTTARPVLFDMFIFVGLSIVSVVGIVYIQEGTRRVPVQYGKRVRGRKQYGGATTHIPLKVNPVGMIPLIFAQSIITFPALLVNLFPDGPLKVSITQTFGQQTGFVYWLSFFVLVVGFTFFYSDVTVANQNISENLQRNGGFIPGIRPGKRTEEYISRVTRRIVLIGALFLGVIAIAPGLVDILDNLMFPLTSVGTRSDNAALVLSGSALIIVVGVVIDTMRQLEAQLVMRNYDRFMR